MNKAQLEILMEEFNKIPGPLLIAANKPIPNGLAEQGYDSIAGIANCVNAIPELVEYITQIHTSLVDIEAELDKFTAISVEIYRRFHILCEAIAGDDKYTDEAVDIAMYEMKKCRQLNTSI